MATVSGRSSRLLSAAAKLHTGGSLGQITLSIWASHVQVGAGGIPVWPGLWLLSQGMGLQMQTRGPKAVRPAREGPALGPLRGQGRDVGRTHSCERGSRLPHEAHRGGSTPLIWKAENLSTVCP